MLVAARLTAAAGLVLALLAPATVRPLAAVCAATLAVLLPFRDSERYGLVAVDGALLVGGVAAVLLATG